MAAAYTVPAPTRLVPRHSEFDPLTAGREASEPCMHCHQRRDRFPENRSPQIGIKIVTIVSMLGIACVGEPSREPVRRQAAGRAARCLAQPFDLGSTMHRA